MNAAIVPAFFTQWRRENLNGLGSHAKTHLRSLGPWCRGKKNTASMITDRLMKEGTPAKHSDAATKCKWVSLIYKMNSQSVELKAWVNTAKSWTFNFHWFLPVLTLKWLLCRFEPSHVWVLLSCHVRTICCVRTGYESKHDTSSSCL